MTDTAHPDRTKHLIVALVFAAAIVWVARMAADQLLNHLHPVPVATRDIPTPTTPSTEAAAREQAAARAEQQRREEALIEADRARRAAQRDAMLKARDAEVAAAREEEDRKQRAWQRFYRKPRQCDTPPDNAALVACSNHYLREQARFEKLYAEGKIKAP